MENFDAELDNTLVVDSDWTFGLLEEALGTALQDPAAWGADLVLGENGEYDDKFRKPLLFEDTEGKTPSCWTLLLHSERQPSPVFMVCLKWLQHQAAKEVSERFQSLYSQFTHVYWDLRQDVFRIRRNAFLGSFFLPDDTTPKQRGCGGNWLDLQAAYAFHARVAGINEAQWGGKHLSAEGLSATAKKLSEMCRAPENRARLDAATAKPNQDDYDRYDIGGGWWKPGQTHLGERDMVSYAAADVLLLRTQSVSVWGAHVWEQHP